MVSRGVLLLLVSYLSMLPAVSAGGIPAGLDALLTAYPETLKAGKDGLIVWPDGSTTPYSVKRRGGEPDYETMLDSASIEEQMSQPYPVGPDSYAPPAKNFDPGRIRNEEFFLKMYGASEAEVRKKLRTITWLPNKAPQKLQVTTVNGVDKKLEEVSAEIEKLPKEVWKFATPSAGTFNWRKIAGTQRMSTHSFATSIDLNVDKSNYWQWDKVPKYRNQFPHEIVEIFEKHGFIWGGKWYHYDTMHFEYRPELLIQAAKAKPGKK